MHIKHPILCVIFIATSITIACGHPRETTKKCHPKLSLEKRCLNPPTVKKVDLSAYTGLWHQIFVSGTSLRVTNLTCVTANYTLASTEPAKIDVLNCQGINSKPRCVKAIATKRMNATLDSQLQVQFFPNLPPGNYNIAALIGLKNYGYYAAAVYSCDLYGSTYKEGFFIIARSPYAPVFTLKRVMRQLRCNGYSVSYKNFIRSQNPGYCNYIKGPGSFDVEEPMIRS